MTDVLFLMLLIQIKHFYIDFINQTDSELAHKRIYGSWAGLTHSIKHCIFTGFAVWLVFENLGLLLITSLALLDLVVHYHVDYIKMKFGSKDLSNRKFWTQFGVDQFAHQLTYIVIIGLIVL